MNTDVKDHSTGFGWVGVLAVAAFIAMWLFCYQADGLWKWGENALSDFGVSKTSAADYFLYGMVISGFLLAIYGIGKIQCSKKVGYGVAGVMFALTGVCVILVGILTNNYHNSDYHDFFGVLASIFMIAGVFAVTIQQYYDGKTYPVGMTMILMLAVFMSIIVFNFEKAEVYCIVIALLWLIMDSAMMIIAGIKGGKKE